MRECFPQLNKIVEVEYKQEVISQEGLSLLRNYTVKHGMPSSIFTYISPEWMIEKGEYQGTYPKRVAQFLRIQCGVYLTEDNLKRIGDIVKPHVMKVGKYNIDFTDRFDWRSGAFGDHGSCFWEDRRSAIVTLEKNKSLAARFYDGNKKGYARCWIVFPTIKSRMYLENDCQIPISSNDNVAIIMNVYGMPQTTIASILSGYLEKSYKKVRLYNNGASSNTFYINGGAGYMIGETKNLKADKVDLKFFSYDEWFKTCIICREDRVFPDEAIELRGSSICQKCAKENPLVKCENCYYQSINTRCTMVKTPNKRNTNEHGEQLWCDYCTKSYATKNKSGEYISNR